MRVLLLAAIACLSLPVAAQDATMAGEVTVPFPTAHGISIEWAISGDANLNGEVAVRYRLPGGAWRQSMPLRRVPAGSNGSFSWTNRHSGSLFDVSPDTDYEVELSLIDPDGGSAQRLLAVRSRAIPGLPGNPVFKEVTPATLSSVIAGANPGDILRFAVGSYPGFTLARSGSVQAPIVLRGQPGVVIEGELALFFRADVIIEDMQVNGRIRFNGSNRITVRRCLINASPTLFDGHGIVSFLRAENAYIVDNTVIGTTAWVESAMGNSGANRGEGIVVTGPGHVIAHNRVHSFRDNISLLEDGEAVDQFSIDIFGNELSEGADDAIEADFCFHNCRVQRNRISNAFVAFSSQPSLGGPTYFVRNVAYNVAHVAFKLYRSSVGDVLLHNTVVKAGDGFSNYASVPVARLFTRNNLFLGGPGGVVNGVSNGDGRVVEAASVVLGGSSLNYNAYGSTVGTFTGHLGPIPFNSLAQLRALTTEAQSVQINLNSFAAAPAFPGNPLTRFSPQDLRLSVDSAAIDAGTSLADINDDFLGAAPDAGAYEASRPLPIYGPRSDMLFTDGFDP